MDDLLKSVSNENEEIRMAHELRELPSRGFSLKMWVSNSLKVSESLPEAERVASLKDLHFEQLPLKRALGVLWNMRMTTCGLEAPSEGNHRHEGVRFQLQAQSSILSVSFRRSASEGDTTGLVSQKVRVVSSEVREHWFRWLKDLPKL